MPATSEETVQQNEDFHQKLNLSQKQLDVLFGQLSKSFVIPQEFLVQNDGCDQEIDMDLCQNEDDAEVSVLVEPLPSTSVVKVVANKTREEDARLSCTSSRTAAGLQEVLLLLAETKTITAKNYTAADVAISRGCSLLSPKEHLEYQHLLNSNHPKSSSMFKQLSCQLNREIKLMSAVFKEMFAPLQQSYTALNVNLMNQMLEYYDSIRPCVSPTDQYQLFRSITSLPSSKSTLLCLPKHRFGSGLIPMLDIHAPMKLNSSLNPRAPPSTKSQSKPTLNPRPQGTLGMVIESVMEESRPKAVFELTDFLTLIEFVAEYQNDYRSSQELIMKCHINANQNDHRYLTFQTFPKRKVTIRDMKETAHAFAAKEVMQVGVQIFDLGHKKYVSDAAISADTSQHGDNNVVWEFDIGGTCVIVHGSVDGYIPKTEDANDQDSSTQMPNLAIITTHLEHLLPLGLAEHLPTSSLISHLVHLLLLSSISPSPLVLMNHISLDDKVINTRRMGMETIMKMLDPLGEYIPQQDDQHGTQEKQSRKIPKLVNDVLNGVARLIHSLLSSSVTGEHLVVHMKNAREISLFQHDSVAAAPPQPKAKHVSLDALFGSATEIDNRWTSSFLPPVFWEGQVGGTGWVMDWDSVDTVMANNHDNVMNALMTVGTSPLLLRVLNVQLFNEWKIARQEYLHSSTLSSNDQGKKPKHPSNHKSGKRKNQHADTEKTNKPRIRFADEPIESSVCYDMNIDYDDLLDGFGR